MITSDLFMDAHVGLISNRHPQPVEGYIWTDTIIDPLDFDVLESQAERWIDDVVKYDLDNQVLDTLLMCYQVLLLHIHPYVFRVDL